MSGFKFPETCSHCGKYIAFNERVCMAELDGDVIGPLHQDCAEQVDAELAQAFRALAAMGGGRRRD